MKAKALLFLSVLLLATTPANACLTRQLSAPPVLADYMSHTLGVSNNQLQAFAAAFARDKAYYDALTLELCGMDMASGDEAQALTSADAKIMDQLIDKWKKIGAALQAAKAPPADAPAPACKVAEDCKAYCIDKAKDSECMPNGAANCTAGVCGCLMTCR